MFKPDIDRVQELLGRRWMVNGFKKLSEPIDTDSEIYVAVRITEDSKDENWFRHIFLEPSLLALECGVRDDENGEFYHIGAYYENDVLVVTSSRGVNLKLAKE